MFPSTIIFGLLGMTPFVAASPFVPDVLARAVCSADNCARAVTGTTSNIKPSLASRRADCSSFFSITVTPVTTVTATSFTATVTTVISTSVTATTDVSTTTSTTTAPLMNKRAATPVTAITSSPSKVPAYASACSGTARYSSACSCFGIAQQTSTASTSTSTTTIFAVSTASVVTTTTTTISSTTTTTIAQPTACSDAQTNVCGNCYCEIAVSDGRPICARQLNDFQSGSACNTDADCVNSGQGIFCVYDGDNSFLRGVGARICATNICANRNKRGIAKRELERVFDEAGLLVTITNTE